MGDTVLKFIKTYKKEIIIVLTIIILVWFIRREWPVISLWFQPRNITLQPGENPTISDTRQAYLKNLASLVYTDLNDANILTCIPFRVGCVTPSLYTEVNAVTDNELLFLSDYFKQYLSGGTTLYSMLNSTDFTDSSTKTPLLSHLAKIGER